MVDGDHRVAIVTNREMREGEELFYNYRYDKRVSGDGPPCSAGTALLSRDCIAQQGLHCSEHVGRRREGGLPPPRPLLLHLRDFMGLHTER